MIMPLHSSLGHRKRFYLYKKKERKERKWDVSKDIVTMWFLGLRSLLGPDVALRRMASSLYGVVLVLVSQKADPEASILVQVVYLEVYPRTHSEGEGKPERGGKPNK